MPKEKTLVVHRDYFDRELAVEDFVVFSVRNLFQVGRIISVTPKMLRVAGYDHAKKNWRTGETIGNLKYGYEVLKVDPQEVTMYLLRKSN